MNYLDIGILAVLAAFIIVGFAKGFASQLVGFLSTVISFVLAQTLYPRVSEQLALLGLLERLKLGVSDKLGLEAYITEHSADSAGELIGALPLPGFLKDSLNASLPDVYNLLGLNELNDYICSAIAGAILDVISMLLVFILVFLLMRLLAKAMGLVNKIPLLGSLNRFLGGILGLLEGSLAVWLVILLLSVCFGADQGSAVAMALSGSTIAVWFLGIL